MKRVLTGLVILILCLVFLTVGGMRTIPVYEEDVGQEELAFFETISEIEVTEDATFSGIFVSEKTGRLIGKHDRSQPRGRQACPT